MLYVTTRNKDDTFTAQRILTLRRGPDGGLFVPYRIPAISQDEIAGLVNQNFNANLASVINLLFGSRLSSYDIDLVLGRQSIRLKQLGQKQIIGECWHNTDWNFERVVQDITSLISKDMCARPEKNGWAKTGIRIAVLFGIFGELIRNKIAGPENLVDIALISGDFSGPMAAWYARSMGLPIGNIVCCCNENAAMWDFICHGTLRTDGTALSTSVPEADILIPDCLEQLISLYGGPYEVERYLEILRHGGTYCIDDSFLKRLRQGIYVTVSSEQRIFTTIPNVFSTHQYLMGPSAALSYSGLQDYRARTGMMRTALILTENAPICELEKISACIGLPEDKLKQFI